MHTENIILERRE